MAEGAHRTGTGMIWQLLAPGRLPGDWGYLAGLSWHYCGQTEQRQELVPPTGLHSAQPRDPAEDSWTLAGTILLLDSRPGGMRGRERPSSPALWGQGEEREPDALTQQWHFLPFYLHLGRDTSRQCGPPPAH